MRILQPPWTIVLGDVEFTNIVGMVSFLAHGGVLEAGDRRFRATGCRGRVEPL